MIGTDVIVVFQGTEEDFQETGILLTIFRSRTFMSLVILFATGAGAGSFKREFRHLRSSGEADSARLSAESSKPSSIA